MPSSRTYERRFRKSAKQAGLIVEEARPIRCKKPVANKKGDLVKKVTCPDAHVIDPDTGREMHVEITKGRGGTGHKKAQQRVAEAAGIGNYIQLTGEQVEKLVSARTKEKKRSLLFSFFGWILIFGL